MAHLRVVNEAVRPRILILLSSTNASRFTFLKSREGTVREIDDLDEVSPLEWDIIVTDDVLATHSSMNGDEYGWWRRRVPLGLHVFVVHREEMGPTIDLVVEAADDAHPSLAIKHVSGVAGNAASRVESLGSELQRHSQKILVPIVSARTYQWGHRPLDVTGDKSFKMKTYVPFLIAAGTTVVAAHYARGPEDSVWLIPEDVPDFEPWWDLAMAEWHDRSPDRIPGLPQWQRSPSWMTGDEQSVISELASERAEFADTEARHEKAVERLENQLTSLNLQADAAERILLTGQGDELQATVLLALTEIGFQVQDMDEVWDARERREDYRIRDSDDPSWIVIADATGTSGGTPGSKLQNLSAYVNKYMLDERPESIPGQWLISNQFIGRDPLTRKEVLRGDDLRAFSAANGLAIDTAALFVLRRALVADQSQRASMRAWLRSSAGQLRLADAQAWLEARSELRT